MRREGSGTRATYSSTVVGALLRFDAGRAADFGFFIRRCYFIPGARFERQRRSMATRWVSFMTRPVVRVTFIQISPANVVNVKPSQDATPKNSCGASFRTAKKVPMDI